jgi:hypothetical protein
MNIIRGKKVHAHLLAFWILARLIFNPEDGSDVFL